MRSARRAEAKSRAENSLFDSDSELEPRERGGGGPEGTHPDVDGWDGGTP